MTVAHTVGSAAPSKILAGTTPISKVMIGDTQVWPDAPPVDEPPYLYGIEQVNQPGRVVNFTALKGFVPEGDALGDEAFMFRCSTISGLDGYVARSFTKTFPSSTAYTKFDCTLEDLYGDGTNAAGSLTKAKISFQATPTA
jgi:hypothetical protein